MNNNDSRRLIGNDYNLAQLRNDMEWVKRTLARMESRQEDYVTRREFDSLKKIFFTLLLFFTTSFFMLLIEVIRSAFL